jgi:phospholipid/cholesterol/gamma-HCH transport system substrate-binding protein
MTSRAYAFATGLFVLLLIGAVIIGAIWLGGSHQPTKPYIVVTTEDVDGLTSQSSVSFRGIPAGKVTALRFDPSDPHRILIDIAVPVATPVTEDTYAVLKLRGVTGGSELALQTGGTSTVPLATSARSPARIAMRPSLLDRLSASGTQLLSRLDTLSAALNEALGAQNLQHLAQALAQADAASAGLVKLAADLDVAARGVPALSARLQTSLARLDELTTEFSRLARTAEQLSAVAVATGGKVNRDTLPRLDAALADLSAAARDIRSLTESLHDNPQQLLMGPERPAPGPGEGGYRSAR